MGYALWDSGSSGQPCFLPLGNYVIHERSFSHHLPYDFVRSGSENLLSDPLLLRKIHRNHLPGHILLILGYPLAFSAVSHACCPAIGNFLFPLLVWNVFALLSGNRPSAFPVYCLLVDNTQRDPLVCQGDARMDQHSPLLRTAIVSHSLDRFPVSKSNSGSILNS